MDYRIIVPKAVGEPFIETAQTASEAMTKLAANRMLFGAAEVYVERADGTRPSDAELRCERALEQLDVAA